MISSISRGSLALLLVVGVVLAGCSGGGATSEDSTSSSPAFALPVVHSFVAEPSAIVIGASTVLRWSVSGVESVSIAPAPGSVSGGQSVVAPAVTTTYTLTARSAQGTVTRTVRVLVHTTGAVLHPQYAALDMRSMPLYGTAGFTYETPELPVTTRSVTITSSGSQARADLVSQCMQGGVAVTVPDSAGDIGHVGFAGVRDCDITLGPNVRIQSLVLCRLANSFCFESNPPPLQPTQRVRLRGGQIGGVSLHHSASDIVLDGVVINNGIMPSSGRMQTAVGMSDANRVAVVNSLIRMVPVDMGGGISDGTGFMTSNARNVIVANNNMVTAGNRNSWAFRLSGGFNWIIMDNTIRVSHHKLVRFNDADVGYVYIKGGVWMRDGAAASDVVDTFANIGSNTTTDNVYIHDTTVYLSPGGGPVTFGAHMGGGSQVNGLWEARRISWVARNAAVVSDTVLADLASSRCGTDDICDYGVGTHTYTYDANLVLPTNAWRTLGGFSNSDPDQLPIEP